MADTKWTLVYAGREWTIDDESAESVKGWRSAEGGIVTITQKELRVVLQFSESIPFALLERRERSGTPAVIL